MSRKTILRIVFAILLGEITLILLTTFAQEVLFDGISYRISSNFDIYVGGFATFIAAVFAGLIASFINKVKNYIPQIIISFFISVETIFLISSNRTGDPIWADVLAGLSLIIGIWLGHFIVQRYLLKPPN